jgi:hypothetical protein
MGKIIWVTPKEIIQKWGSFDFDCADDFTWDEYLGYREQDPQFECVKESIRKYGFKQPLTFTKERQEVDGKLVLRKVHGDGHHRLCAAIQLGYKRIPYLYVEKLKEHISKDTWDFHPKDFGRIEKMTTTYIHPANPLPLVNSQQLVSA